LGLDGVQGRVLKRIGRSWIQTSRASSAQTSIGTSKTGGEAFNKWSRTREGLPRQKHLNGNKFPFKEDFPLPQIRIDDTSRGKTSVADSRGALVTS